MFTPKMLLKLFTTFFKIGLFSFGGGFAMIPLIQREVIERHKWINSKDFVDMLVLAQSTPGPIAVNTAVFVGYKTAGIAGAVAATFGTVLPSFIVILLLALFFAEVRENRYVDAAFRAMRPAVVALIVAPLMGLVKGMKWYLIAISAAVALLVWYFGFSPMYLIAGGVAVGIAMAIYNGRKGVQR
ncbi:MAG: chromate transporter [Rikenellaceae bacterium]|nr:chromate transporter [Rikenellaceae bacterium]